MKRGKPLQQVGRKAKREGAARDEMRRVVHGECGGRCVARSIVPEVRCWSSGPLEVHEVIDRSVRPGVHLDPDYGVTLCRAHHEWVSEDATRARDRGLSFYSHDFEAARARVVELRRLVWAQ